MPIKSVTKMFRASSRRSVSAWWPRVTGTTLFSTEGHRKVLADCREQDALQTGGGYIAITHPPTDAKRSSSICLIFTRHPPHYWEGLSKLGASNAAATLATEAVLHVFICSSLNASQTCTRLPSGAGCVHAASHARTLALHECPSMYNDMLLFYLCLLYV